MQDSKRDTETKNRLLDSVEEGQGGTIWENSIETCILSYVKQMTKQNTQSWCSGTTQRDGVGGGRWEWGSGWGRHMYTHEWFMSMYGKNHNDIVKYLASN